MKYKIQIEGGFSGIPKVYEGESVLDENEQNSLLEALQIKSVQNKKLRDGLKYHIELRTENEVFKGEFNEVNLPLKIREFISSIQ